MKNINLNKTLRLGSIIHILLSSPVSSSEIKNVYDINDFSMGSYKMHYNDLTEKVEERRDALKKKINPENHKNFKTFMGAAEEKILSYNLEQYIGFRLIHRHFEIGENEIMSEEKSNNGERLLTFAQGKEEAKGKGAVPASWIFDKNGRIQLFEASNDPAVIEGNNLLKRNPSFIKEMQDLMLSYGMHDFLALAILKRQALTADNTQVYIENNELADDNRTGISIVTVGNIDPSQKEIYTTTSWNFTNDIENLTQSLWDKINNSGSARLLEQVNTQESRRIFEEENPQTSELLKLTSLKITDKRFLKTYGIQEKIDGLTFEDGQFKVMINGNAHQIYEPFKKGFPSGLLTAVQVQKFLDNEGYFILRQFSDNYYSLEATMRVLGGVKCRKRNVCVGVRYGPFGIIRAHAGVTQHK